MGEVYRARDERLSRDVALKILSSDVGAAEALRRFEQEARAASALNHPNIITIYDIGRFDEIAYIAMELIEGRDLRSLMAGERMQLKQILRIAVKVTDGLAAAHERGIVHRDLKPENLMITRDGYVKILDFGLAKLVRPISASEATLPLTTPGVVFGTVGYMSPEQASGKPIDFRSDQFALGVILYELITRRLPFTAATAAEILAAIIREEPAPMEQYDPNLPPELVRIVQRLLAKSPDDRYAATRDLLRDLREVRDRITHSSDDRHRTLPKLLPFRSKSVATAVVVVSLFAFVSGAVWMFRGRVAPPSLAAASERSLAVIFRDLSNTPDGQMLTDGMSATIAARLAQAPGLRLASPPAGEEAAKGDPADIARRSGADLVLQAGLQRVGEQLRVNFSVMDAGSGNQVAGDSITGTAGDLFALQDLVAERVLQKLNVRELSAPVTRPSTMASAADQRKFVEASGLLWRLQDDAAIDQAIARLEALLANARDSAPVNGLLGRAYLMKYRSAKNSADLEQATLFVERAAQLDASIPEVHTALGELRMRTGRLAEAETAYRKALSLQPKDPAATVGLAETLEQMGRGADAEGYYAKATTLAPDWPAAFAKYGRFAFERGRQEKAIEMFRRMVELLPESPRGYSNLGAALQSAGRYEEALKAYERSIALRPTHRGYSNRGSCEYSLGRYAAAASSFGKAAELAPASSVYWMNLGDAQRWAEGMQNESRRSYDRAITATAAEIKANPQDPMPHAIAAASLARSGRLDQARAAVDRALKIDPTHAVALYQAAVIAHLRGDRDGTLAWLRRAAASGYPAGDVDRDPEFRAMQKDPEFQKAIARPSAS